MIAKNFFNLLVLLALLSPVKAADLAETERDLCRTNLFTIYNAIQSYRTDHKDVPGWLSDLVPKYLKDPNVFTCPSVRRTGNFSGIGIEDPKLASTYSYQFSDGPIPKVVPGGAGFTMKEWKRRQMSLVGGKVPMIRCHNHDQVLSVTFDGKFSEGEGAWENALRNEIDVAELFPNRIFAREAAIAAAARAQASIPKRPTNATPNLIDLSTHFNAALNESWNPPGNPNTPAHHLEALPHGIQKLAGIDFDIRGRVQLGSKKLTQARYMHTAKNIKIDQKAARLHFLNGTGWSAATGSPVCNYVIRYASGKSETFTLRYGANLIDWAKPGEIQDPQASTLAWSGPSPVNQIELRLYKTQWTNPNPDETIASIDFISANNDPAPMLIAITAESL